MNGLLTDGMAIGTLSAQAVTGMTVAKAARPAGMNPVAAWKPGDALMSGGILGEAGLKEPMAAEAGDAAGKLAAGARISAGRALVEGSESGASAAQTGGKVFAAVTDKVKTAASVLDQITSGTAQAASHWYLQVAVQWVEWQTADDVRVCFTCMENEAAGPVRLGDPFPSGDTGVPGHFRCRCALLPAGWQSPPPQPITAEPAEDGEPDEPGDDDAADDGDGSGRDAGTDDDSGEAEPAEPGSDEAEPGVRDPVAEAGALADAYSTGYDEGERLTGGQGGVPVRRVTLSDGTEAVLKTGQEPEEALNAYLAGLVAGALGIDGAVAALTGNDTLVARLLKGETGAELRQAAGDLGWTGGRTDELERIMQLQDGREIGVLDFLTANADRNDGNYLVDGGQVRPIDHALANFQELAGADGEAEVLSPFARYYTAPGADIAEQDGIPVGDLVNPLSADETAALRSSLESLEGEFTAKGATSQYGFMMDRLTLLEAAS